MMNTWVYHGAFLESPSPSHSRSISLGAPLAPSPRDHLAKAKSTSALRTMADVDAEQENSNTAQAQDGSPENSFRTIADPRNSNPSGLSRSDSTSSRHPDLNNEVAALSDKLISAINHSTNLDDTLSQTRQELEASKARIAKLEAESKMHQERVVEERRQKEAAQKEKRGMEAELETLTASLFDEANKMVAAANRDRDATEKKNQQLRDQIKDGEDIINSQVEQLSELKLLMQQFGPEPNYRREIDSPRISLPPSSPGVPGVQREDSNLAKLLEAMNLSPLSTEHGEITPSPSTTLTHLVKALCRTDIPAYDDFKNLVQTGQFRSHNPSHAPSRAGSGSYGSLNVMGLGALNSSNPNLSTVNNSSKLNSSPNLPGSFSPNPGQGPILLKETRFYKRLLAEDIEPALRLDLSPTLSWLNRRSITAALGDSALIVEPIPEASLRLYGKYTPCAICGEARKAGENPRTHAMRVREGEGATKWSVCTLCLEKVRGVGDLVAYVKNIREGVVKVGDKRDEEEVWEELVRLRERLFWARMAGGVVPAFLPTPKQVPADASALEPAAPGENPTTPPGSSGKETEADTETESESEQAARLQLQSGLDESLTTFDNIKEKRISLNAQDSTPPSTPSPSRKRESSGTGFPKISIPKLPDGFWQSQVNTLH